MFDNAVPARNCKSPLLETTNDPFSRAPIVLVGNKSDLRKEREVPIQEGIDLATELGCTFVETSAKHGINVEMVFFDIVRQLRKQKLSEQPSNNKYQNLGSKINRRKRRLRRFCSEGEENDDYGLGHQQAEGNSRCTIL